MVLYGKVGRFKFFCLKKKDYINYQFIVKLKDKFSLSQKIKYKNIKFFILSKLLILCIYCKFFIVNIFVNYMMLLILKVVNCVFL